MNYSETLEFLFNSLPAYHRIGEAAYKSDLSTTLYLDNYFGSPHHNYKSIHIAGTNGKGSVASSLASVLSEAGYKVALYTSPHLIDFRERIKIDGRKIPENYVQSFVADHKSIIDKLKPSFFEMTAAMAFQYFSDMEVDIALIETGMGGRLDSTNILNPILSVITNISFDHTRFLGTSLAEIAGEKAGIIKNNTPVVVGRSSSDTDPVFISTAKKMNANLRFADKIYGIQSAKTIMDGSNQIVEIAKNESRYLNDLEINLGGNYQLENLVCSIAVLDLIKEDFHLDEAVIRSGLRNITRNTGLQGRWQILQQNPLVVCDTAHNVDGISSILNQLKSLGKKSLRFVLGFVNDKDIDAILRLLPREATYYFTTSSVPRSMKGEELAVKASELGLSGTVCGSVPEAYKMAFKDLNQDEVLYIGGSTFIVADLLEHIS